jgi:hypothetical protein
MEIEMTDNTGDQPSVAQNNPVEITLRFKSVEDKKEFLGGLMDGWGENYCNLIWDWEAGVQFSDAPAFDVEVIDVREALGLEPFDEYNFPRFRFIDGLGDDDGE